MKFVSLVSLAAWATAAASASSISDYLVKEHVDSLGSFLSVLEEPSSFKSDSERERKTKDLITCFESNAETNGKDCWDCVVRPGSDCEVYCMDVEQCRSDTCSSGSACMSQYYDVLNFELDKTLPSTEECVCDGTWNKEDLVDPVVQETEPVLEEAASDPSTDLKDAALVDDFDPKELIRRSHVLLACFEENGEADGAACWEECVYPPFETGTTCEGIGTDIESCRSVKCSSGSACKKEYYSALNYAMDDTDVVQGCVLEESLYAQDSAPVVEISDKELIDRSKALLECFEDNGETDGVACWEECVFPAFETETTCEGIGSEVEQCRSKKCSSGSACKSEYYSALNYAMDDTDVVQECTLPVDDFSAKELIGRSKALLACFEDNGETDGVACWEECVSIAFETGTTCEGIGSEVEQCRSKKCSSGSACKSEYYSALNYAMDDTDVVQGCTLPVDDFSAEELIGRSKALLACFEDNGETDGVACWEECVFPAFETGTTCEGVGSEVEQCRSKKCSSGSACKSEYYSALNYAMDDADVVQECVLDGSRVDQCDANVENCTPVSHVEM